MVDKTLSKAMFDYAQVTPDIAGKLRRIERDITAAWTTLAESAMKYGEELASAQDVLADYRAGLFVQWIESTFPFSQRTAYNYIAMWRTWKGTDISRVDVTAAQKLAAPSTPEPALKAARNLIAAGKPITHETAAKLIADSKPSLPKRGRVAKFANLNPEEGGDASEATDTISGDDESCENDVPNKSDAQESVEPSLNGQQMAAEKAHPDGIKLDRACKNCKANGIAMNWWDSKRLTCLRCNHDVEGKEPGQIEAAAKNGHAKKSILDELKGPVPESLNWVFEDGPRQFRSWIQQLGKMREEIVGYLKDDERPGDYIPGQDIEKMFDELQAALKHAIPHTECCHCRRKLDAKCRVCQGRGWLNKPTHAKNTTKDGEKWLESRGVA